jgi:MFS family permease
MITGIYYSLTFGLAVLVAGKISDRFPRRNLLMIFCLCWNLTSIGSMLANQFFMLAIMRIMFGLFSAFSSPICYSLISDYFPPINRTVANACFTAASFFGIAFAALSNILVDSVGWRFTYGICASYGLFVFVLIVFFVKEPERGRFEPKKS